ncbi:hypothetical protein D9M71_765890 [compost metagenome]
MVSIVTNIESAESCVDCTLLSEKSNPLGMSSDVLKFAWTAGWEVGVGTTTFNSIIRPTIDGVVTEYIRVDLVWWSVKDWVKNKSIGAAPRHALELAVLTQIGEGHAFLCNGGGTWVPGIVGG